MVQKLIIMFWWEFGLSSASKSTSPLFANPPSTMHVQDCVPRQLTLSETIVFILSAKADQPKRYFCSMIELLARAQKQLFLT